MRRSRKPFRGIIPPTRVRIPPPPLMTIWLTRKRDLDRFRLARGRHARLLPGRCTMEAVAYYAGERHSDRPQTASPLLASYIRPLNDAWDDEQRQRLKAL